MGTPIDIEGPLGGLSQNMSPRHIPPTDFVKAENVVNVAGVMRPRPGRSLAFAGQTGDTGGCFFDAASLGAVFELALDETTTPHTLYYIFQAAVAGSPSIRSVRVDGTGDAEIASAAALGNATEARGLRYSASSTAAPHSLTITQDKRVIIQGLGISGFPAQTFKVQVITSGSTQTTGVLNSATSASAMEAAIEGLSNVVDVTVTRTTGGSDVFWDILFVDPTTDVSDPVFPGAYPTVSIVETGAELQFVVLEYKIYTVVARNLAGPTDTFTLTVEMPSGGPQTTVPLNLTTTAVEMDNALQALSNVVRTSVTKTSLSSMSKWVITITNPNVPSTGAQKRYPLMTGALTFPPTWTNPAPGYLVAVQGGTLDRYIVAIHPERDTANRVRQIIQLSTGATAYGGWAIRYPWILVSAALTASTSEIIAVRDGESIQNTLFSAPNFGEYRQFAWNQDDLTAYVTNSDIENPDGTTIHILKTGMGTQETSPPVVLSDTTFTAPYSVADLYYNPTLRRLYFTTDEDVLGSQNVYFCPVQQDGVLGDAFKIATTTDALDHPRGIAVDSQGNVYWSTVRE